MELPELVMVEGTDPWDEEVTGMSNHRLLWESCLGGTVGKKLNLELVQDLFSLRARPLATSPSSLSNVVYHNIYTHLT